MHVLILNDVIHLAIALVSVVLVSILVVALLLPPGPTKLECFGTLCLLMVGVILGRVDPVAACVC